LRRMMPLRGVPSLSFAVAWASSSTGSYPFATGGQSKVLHYPFAATEASPTWRGDTGIILLTGAGLCYQRRSSRRFRPSSSSSSSLTTRRGAASSLARLGFGFLFPHVDPVMAFRAVLGSQQLLRRRPTLLLPTRVPPTARRLLLLLLLLDHPTRGRLLPCQTGIRLPLPSRRRSGSPSLPFCCN
jgi:hypothetical protein